MNNQNTFYDAIGTRSNAKMYKGKPILFERYYTDAAFQFTSSFPKAVLLHQILYWADKYKDGQFYKSLASWSSEFGFSVNTVSNALKDFESKGYIKTWIEQEEGSPTTTIQFQPEVFFPEWETFLENEYIDPEDRKKRRPKRIKVVAVAPENPTVSDDVLEAEIVEVDNALERVLIPHYDIKGLDVQKTLGEYRNLANQYANDVNVLADIMFEVYRVTRGENIPRTPQILKEAMDFVKERLKLDVTIGDNIGVIAWGFEHKQLQFNGGISWKGFANVYSIGRNNVLSPDSHKLDRFSQSYKDYEEKYGHLKDDPDVIAALNGIDPYAKPKEVFEL